MGYGEGAREGQKIPKAPYVPLRNVSYSGHLKCPQCKHINVWDKQGSFFDHVHVLTIPKWSFFVEITHFFILDYGTKVIFREITHLSIFKPWHSGHFLLKLLTCPFSDKASALIVVLSGGD